MQQFLRFCSNKIWHSIIAIVCLALARYYCNVVVLRVRAGLNKGAFNRCLDLKGVTILNGVDEIEIGDWAFAFCRGLMWVRIPGRVTHIGYMAFCECRNLMDAGFNNATTGWSCTPKEAATGDDTIPIPASDLEKYERAAKYLRETYVDCYWDRAIS